MLLDRFEAEGVKMKDIEIFGAAFPFLDVEWTLGVEGEEDITAGAILTLNAVITRKTVADIEAPDDDSASALGEYPAVTKKKSELSQAYLDKMTGKKSSNKVKGKKGGGKKAVSSVSLATPVVTESGEAAATSAKTEEEVKDVPVPATTALAGAGDGHNCSDDSASDKSDSDYSDSDSDFDWNADEIELELEREREKEKARKLKKRESFPVHCPYYPGHKQECWWVFIGNEKDDILVTQPQKVMTLKDVEEVKLQFQGPPKVGTYELELYIVSDS